VIVEHISQQALLQQRIMGSGPTARSHTS
jgi:hypothetical protein